MSHSKGVIDPAQRDDNEMFIGWGKPPDVDRRFLLGALPIGFASVAGFSWLNASMVSDPGAGQWLTDATHEITGALITDPYPMIRIADPAAPFGVRTVLVVAQGKCTSALDLADQNAKLVTASGVLIERKDRRMLEVPPFLEDWLREAKPEKLRPPSSVPKEGVDVRVIVNSNEESLGRARLAGKIMDSKCFFGVMRPAQGKTHKACASLCIRGGIPPSFWVRTNDGGESIMLMTTTDGDPMPMDILPLVADPVEATGEIVRVGDLLHFRADASAYKRV